MIISNPYVFGAGGGSSPVLLASATGTDAFTNNETSGTVQFPSGIVSGNLLLIVAAFTGLPGAITWPTGFTQVCISTSGNTVAVAYKIATGSEGSSGSISWVNKRSMRFWCGRIGSAHGSAAPEGDTATGSGNTPNPPSLTPTWGSAYNMWMVIGVGGTDFTAFPTNYSDNQYNTAGGADPQLALATRNLTDTVQDPGTFTKGGGGWAAATVAVRPA